MKMDDRFEVFSQVLESFYDMIRTISNYYYEPREYGTKHKITVMEAHMIQEIARNPDAGITDLTNRLNKTKGAVSQIVDKLTLKGLVVKESDKSDNRKKRLILTEDGEKINKYHQELDNRFFMKVFKHLPEFEKSELEEYFAKHNKIMEAILAAIEEGKAERKN